MSSFSWVTFETFVPGASRSSWRVTRGPVTRPDELAPRCRSGPASRPAAWRSASWFEVSGPWPLPEERSSVGSGSAVVELVGLGHGRSGACPAASARARPWARRRPRRAASAVLGRSGRHRARPARAGPAPRLRAPRPRPRTSPGPTGGSSGSGAARCDLGLAVRLLVVGGPACVLARRGALVGQSLAQARPCRARPAARGAADQLGDGGAGQEQHAGGEQRTRRRDARPRAENSVEVAQ